MLKKMASQAAGQMGHHLQASDDDISVYAYSLEIVFIGICQISGYLFVAILLGLFMPTFLVILSHTGFRFFGGGYHLKTFARCLIFSGLLIAFLVWVALLPWPVWLTWYVLGSTALAAILIIYKWVPAGTEKKTIQDPKLRKRQKEKTFLFALLTLAITIILELHHYPQYAQSLIMGVWGALFCISPWGYAFWETVDRILDEWRKEA